MSYQRKAANSPPAKKVIFNARPVAARLAALKDAAGDADTAWWLPALTFEWVAPRKGNNGTQWASVNYKDENGLSGRLVIRINGERHVGQIMPNTDAGLAELTTRVKNPKAQLKKRDKKPSVQIQKWSTQVKTAEDGVTLLYDDDGQPILPGDDKLSPYYQVAALVGEAFLAEAQERVDRGLALVKMAIDMKKADRGATAQGVLDAFNAAQAARRPGDMVLSSESVANLRKAFANPKDVDLLAKGATLTSNVKIAPLTQEYISSQSGRNGGQPLPNPMTRFAMNFDTTTGVSQMSFFDKGKAYVEQDTNRPKYEVGMVDGYPINADNIHKFVVSRCTLDGIINMDSVCFSSMGISMPVKADVLVVEQPPDRGVDLDDVYDDEDGYAPPAAGGHGGSPPGSPVPDPAAGCARPAGAVAPPDADEDYEGLLSELGGAKI